MDLNEIKRILEVKGEVDLEVTFELSEDNGIIMHVANEDGTGSSYYVSDSDEIGACLASYVEVYCEDEEDEDE